MHKYPIFSQLLTLGYTATSANSFFSVDIQIQVHNAPRVSRRGTTRADIAQGTPTQSYISPSVLTYEDKLAPTMNVFYSHCCTRSPALNASYITKVELHLERRAGMHGALAGGRGAMSIQRPS